MKDISKKSLMILVLVAVVSSVAASTLTVVSVSWADFVKESYLDFVDQSHISLPTGIITLYVEPQPVVTSGEVHLEVK